MLSLTFLKFILSILMICLQGAYVVVVFFQRIKGDVTVKKIYKTVLLIYCCLMIYLLFLERIGTNYDGYNLVPFDTIRQFFYMAHGSAGGDFTDFALRNLLGNVFMFLPFALFPLVFKKLYSFLKYLVFCFVTILLIELVQFAYSL